MSLLLRFSIFTSNAYNFHSLFNNSQLVNKTNKNCCIFDSVLIFCYYLHFTQFSRENLKLVVYTIHTCYNNWFFFLKSRKLFMWNIGLYLFPFIEGAIKPTGGKKNTWVCLRVWKFFLYFASGIFSLMSWIFFLRVRIYFWKKKCIWKCKR